MKKCLLLLSIYAPLVAQELPLQELSPFFADEEELPFFFFPDEALKVFELKRPSPTQEKLQHFVTNVALPYFKNSPRGLFELKDFVEEWPEELKTLFNSIAWDHFQFHSPQEKAILTVGMSLVFLQSLQESEAPEDQTLAHQIENHFESRVDLNEKFLAVNKNYFEHSQMFQFLFLEALLKKGSFPKKFVGPQEEIVWLKELFETPKQITQEELTLSHLAFLNVLSAHLWVQSEEPSYVWTEDDLQNLRNLVFPLQTDLSEEAQEYLRLHSREYQFQQFSKNRLENRGRDAWRAVSKAYLVGAMGSFLLWKTTKEYLMLQGAFLREESLYLKQMEANPQGSPLYQEASDLAQKQRAYLQKLEKCIKKKWGINTWNEMIQPLLTKELRLGSEKAQFLIQHALPQGTLSIQNGCHSVEAANRVLRQNINRLMEIKNPSLQLTFWNESIQSIHNEIIRSVKQSIYQEFLEKAKTTRTWAKPGYWFLYKSKSGWAGYLLRRKLSQIPFQPRWFQRWSLSWKRIPQDSQVKGVLPGETIGPGFRSILSKASVLLMGYFVFNIFQDAYSAYRIEDLEQEFENFQQTKKEDLNLERLEKLALIPLQSELIDGLNSLNQERISHGKPELEMIPPSLGAWDSEQGQLSYAYTLLRVRGSSLDEQVKNSFHGIIIRFRYQNGWKLDHAVLLSPKDPSRLSQIQRTLRFDGMIFSLDPEAVKVLFFQPSLW